ncbi:MAG: hypothetical protein KKB50_17955 [Planctomycetes bacterium]|nr:hypothetical protein [Planctomycetota bacterium]
MRPALVLLAAVLLSAVAAAQLVRLASRLPLSQARRLTSDNIRRGFQAASSSRETRQAMSLANGSNIFTAALMSASVPETLRAQLGELSLHVTDTQLGRLQQAALAMLELERGRRPVADWWPALQPYLSGLDRATFGHLQSKYNAHATTVMRSLGIDRGTAAELGRLRAGYPHGPFLQFFVRRMQVVADTERASGNAAAARTCEHIVRSLLRQWVLEPGPAGLGLLAADLLAQQLGGDEATTRPAALADLAAQLRRWRAAYHRAAQERPVAFLAPTREPALCPAEHQRLVGWLAVTMWLAATTFGSALLSVASAWFWLKRPAGAGSKRGTLIAAMGVTTLAVAVGLVLMQAWPDLIRADLKREWVLASLTTWPRQLLLGVGFALAVVTLVGLLGRVPDAGPTRRAPRLAARAAAAWLMLVLVLMVCTAFSARARGQYEAAVAAALDNDDYTAVAGPAADVLLDALRAWKP